jgi:hypothetical protein
MTFSALGAVENEQKWHANDHVDDGADELMNPEPVQVLPEQAEADDVDDPVMQEGEAEGEQDARAEIFYIDTNAEQGSKIADDGFADAEDADVLAGEKVLRDAGERAGECAGDGTAAADGKEDDGDEREVKHGRLRNETRQGDLDEDGRKGNEQRNCRMEAMLHHLLPRTVGDRIHGYWGSVVVTGVVVDVGGFGFGVVGVVDGFVAGFGFGVASVVEAPGDFIVGFVAGVDGESELV